MATNSGDLAQSLIEGGLAPQAARIIANAIGNAASPTFSKGRDTLDATPTEALRLITPDIRRYQLTNLDYSPDDPFQSRLESTASQYSPDSADHPYKDSQPVVSAPPLSSPRVQGGFYVGVENSVEGDSAVSRVDLKLRSEQGRHLRLDPTTKSLEAVSMLASTESPKVLAAEWREGEGGTELVISVRNLEEVDVLLSNADSRKALVFPQADPVGPAGLLKNGTRSLTKKAVRWADGTSQDILTWTDGTATAAPASPAATCKAWAVFDGNNFTTVGGEDLCTIAASSNVTKVVRASSGEYEITITTAMSSGNYVILVTAGGGAANEERVVHVRTDGGGPTTTGFKINVRTLGGGPTDSTRVSVAVFE